MTRDPLLGSAASPATLNAFGYGGGNPLAMSDPSGMAFERDDATTPTESGGDMLDPFGTGGGGPPIVPTPGMVAAAGTAVRETVVYVAKKAGQIVYVGITFADRFDARIREHKDRGWDAIQKVASTASRDVARGAEQHFIRTREGLENLRNSIAPKNPIHDPMVEKGRELLEKLGWR